MRNARASPRASGRWAVTGINSPLWLRSYNEKQKRPKAGARRDRTGSPAACHHSPGGHGGRDGSPDEISMCELFALSSRIPTEVRFSFEAFSRRGGLGGRNKDGWGV